MMDWFMFDIAQLSHFHLLRPLWLLALIPLLWTMYHLYRQSSDFYAAIKERYAKLQKNG